MFFKIMFHFEKILASKVLHKDIFKKYFLSPSNISGIKMGKLNINSEMQINTIFRTSVSLVI